MGRRDLAGQIGTGGDRRCLRALLRAAGSAAADRWNEVLPQDRHGDALSRSARAVRSGEDRPRVARSLVAGRAWERLVVASCHETGTATSPSGPPAALGSRWPRPPPRCRSGYLSAARRDRIADVSPPEKSSKKARDAAWNSASPSSPPCGLIYVSLRFGPPSHWRTASYWEESNADSGYFA